MALAEGEITLGGTTYVLRYRAREIRKLDRALKKEASVSLVAAFEEKYFGPDFVFLALICGLEHAFHGKKGKDRLTEDQVDGWIDDYENGPFGVLEVLLPLVMKGAGLSDDEKKKEDGEEDNPPLD